MDRSFSHGFSGLLRNGPLGCCLTAYASTTTTATRTPQNNGFKGPVQLVQLSFNLSRNIVSQQIKCCKFPESCAHDWSVVCKKPWRWRLLYSLFVGRECLPLSLWAFGSMKTKKGPRKRNRKVYVATMDFHTRCPKHYGSPAISWIFCDTSSKPFPFFLLLFVFWRDIRGALKTTIGLCIHPFNKSNICHFPLMTSNSCFQILFRNVHWPKTFPISFLVWSLCTFLNKF